MSNIDEQPPVCPNLQDAIAILFPKARVPGRRRIGFAERTELSFENLEWAVSEVGRPAANAFPWSHEIKALITEIGRNQ